MCKRLRSRRVPPRHCRHQGKHPSPRVTRHAGTTRRRLLGATAGSDGTTAPTAVAPGPSRRAHGASGPRSSPDATRRAAAAAESRAAVDGRRGPAGADPHPRPEGRTRRRPRPRRQAGNAPAGRTAARAGAAPTSRRPRRPGIGSDAAEGPVEARTPGVRGVVAQAHGPGEQLRLETTGRRPAARGDPCAAPRTEPGARAGSRGHERRSPARGPADRTRAWRSCPRPPGAGRCRPCGAGRRRRSGRRGGAPCRPSRAAGPDESTAASSGARRRPPRRDDPGRLGGRRGAAAATGADDGRHLGRVSGARRRPPDDATAGSSGARRRPPVDTAAGTSGARRRPPEGATVASDTTDRSRTMGRLAVADASESARCSRREEGWRATDCSPLGGLGDGRLGRHGEVALGQAQGLEIGPGRLLDTAEDDADPHLAGAVGGVPPAQQLTGPPGPRLIDLDGLRLAGEDSCSVLHGA